MHEGTASEERSDQVTIGDVAAAAGVSRSTVSRAFGRPDLLRPETVDRVIAIATELGYVGNQAARALSTGRFGNIAVVVPDVANSFFPPLLRSAQAAAESAGYAVFLGDSDESAVREDFLLTRLSSQVDGFILASPRLSDERIQHHARQRPLVLINRDLDGTSRVLIDIDGGAVESVRHLAGLGHRTIAYLGGPTESWSDQQRRVSIGEACRRSGLDIVVIELGRPSHTAGRDVVAALLTSQATAAIAFDDVVAQGVLAGLAVRGVDVPRDFSVIGCDDILAATTYPPLTTISAGSSAAGSRAIGLLTKIISTQGLRCRTGGPAHAPGHPRDHRPATRPRARTRVTEAWKH